MCEFISKGDVDYPLLLKKIPDAPESLYFKGRYRPEIFDNCLAVVGSRRMTGYGKSTTSKLIYEIAAQGVTIVSGFMYGIDMTAHRTALAAGGKTIAVLAYGIKRNPPNYLRETYDEILASGGLVVSELAENEPPKKWSFPKRNRIIAGLSQAVLVVEASLKSGSLITAKYAKSYQRKIFAVPGPINSHNSSGTLQLISEGAEMVLDAQQIVDFYGIARGEHGGQLSEGLCKEAANSRQTNTKGEIISYIREQPSTLDELTAVVERPVTEINIELTRLMLAGQVIEEEGRFHARYR